MRAAAVPGTWPISWPKLSLVLDSDFTCRDFEENHFEDLPAKFRVFFYNAVPRDRSITGRNMFCRPGHSSPLGCGGRRPRDKSCSTSPLRNRHGVNPRMCGAFARCASRCRTGATTCSPPPACFDTKLAHIAQTHETGEDFVREACVPLRLPSTSTAYWQSWNRLRAKIGGSFHTQFDAVTRVMAQTPRSSALVENPNSGLRTYFTLPRHLGNA
jgi:hypothetical protein